MSAIMSRERVSPTGHGRCALLLITAMLACYGPIAAGVVAGALRVSANGAITVDAITLEPSEPARRPSTHFDQQARRLALKNVSVRHLISLAYPASQVHSDPDLIDRVHYDIEARWHEQSATSAKYVYRELLDRILRNNSNLRIYFGDRCDGECTR
jgi:hypothetical protein